MDPGSGQREQHHRRWMSSPPTNGHRDLLKLPGRASALHANAYTVIVQALYRLNPVESSTVFDEVIDFPSRLTRQRKQGQKVAAVTATFRLADDEIATIEADLGAGALTSREITV